MTGVWGEYFIARTGGGFDFRFRSRIIEAVAETAETVARIHTTGPGILTGRLFVLTFCVETSDTVADADGIELLRGEFVICSDTARFTPLPAAGWLDELSADFSCNFSSASSAALVGASIVAPR